jgi:hypothetical protein
MVRTVQTARVVKDVQSARRRAVQKLIDERWAGNASAFARAAKKPQSQIADMLRGEKSFGEKVARSIEKNLGLADGALDLPAAGRAPPADPSPLSPGALVIARLWDQLPTPAQECVAQIVDLFAKH